MISALWKPHTSPSDSSHDTDAYHKLQGTGSEVSGGVELNKITRTTDIRVTNEKMKEGQQVTATRLVWEGETLGTAR